MANTRKLIVEVVDARYLMPKDGQGSISPYVQVEFNNQCKKTQTVVRNLNPVWNETFSFNLDSSSKLKLKVYHDKNICEIHRSLFLGEVKLSSTLFVPKGEEVLKYYPLRNTWTRCLQCKTIKYGSEISVKLYHVDHEEVHLIPSSSKEELAPQPQPDIPSSSLLPPSSSPDIEKEKPNNVTSHQEIEKIPTSVPEIVEEPLTTCGEPRQEEVRVNLATSTTRKVLRKMLDCQNFVAMFFKRG